MAWLVDIFTVELRTSHFALRLHPPLLMTWFQYVEKYVYPLSRAVLGAGIDLKAIKIVSVVGLQPGWGAQELLAVPTAAALVVVTP